MYSPVHTTTPRTMGGLLNHAWPIKIAYLDSALHFREPTPFSKVSFFVCPHENGVFSEVSVLKNLHFQRHFRKYSFSMKTTSPMDRLRVDGRLKRIKKTNCVLLRKRIRVDGAISNTLFSDDDSDRMFT